MLRLQTQQQNHYFYIIPGLNDKKTQQAENYRWLNNALIELTGKTPTKRGIDWAILVLFFSPFLLLATVLLAICIL